MDEALEQKSIQLFEDEIKWMDARADAMEKHLLTLAPDDPRRGDIEEAINRRRKEIAFYKQLVAHWKR